MPSYVIEPPPRPALPVVGSDQLFPIRRVYCVGRNYAEHALEMGGDPKREPPFFFQKNPDAFVTTGEFPYPTRTSDVHHEMELVAALGKGGANIPVDAALECVWGYAVALDMTRRDLQGEAKKLGRPWEVGKSFESAAPSSRLVPASKIGHPTKGAIWLDVNGQRRQTGDVSQMIWKIPEIISQLSTLFTLGPGDLIMTGTPAGVGAVKKGDLLRGGVEGVGEIEIRVV